MGTQQETVSNKSNCALKVLYAVLNGKFGLTPLPPALPQQTPTDLLFQQQVVQQLCFIEKERNKYKEKYVEEKGGESKEKKRT